MDLLLVSWAWVNRGVQRSEHGNDLLLPVQLARWNVHSVELFFHIVEALAVNKLKDKIDLANVTFVSDEVPGPEHIIPMKADQIKA